jgi:hypothetical protein
MAYRSRWHWLFEGKRQDKEVARKEDMDGQKRSNSLLVTGLERVSFSLIE